jgi:hypothetical protein
MGEEKEEEEVCGVTRPYIGGCEGILSLSDLKGSE